MSIRWSADDEDLDAIVELAREYDLVLYDPQGLPSTPPPTRTKGCRTCPTPASTFAAYSSSGSDCLWR